MGRATPALKPYALRWVNLCAWFPASYCRARVANLLARKERLFHLIRGGQENGLVLTFARYPSPRTGLFGVDELNPFSERGRKG
ncbi:hypothetical protein LY76DRAFT_281240 [Colletotrichum caudatum]|nr:hypothetical protein LY76DRAFT_281240 [Colletotrichum caudatum]